MTSDQQDQRLVRMVTNLAKAKAMLPDIESQNPTKDFSRVRYWFDQIERALLANDEDAALAALLEHEQECYRLGIPGFTQKHLDC